METRSVAKIATVMLAALLMLAASLSPVADSALDGVGLEQLATQPAAASEFNNAFCWGLGASFSAAGPGWGLIGGASVAFACTRPGWGSNATCAKWVSTTTYRSVYGYRHHQSPANVFYVYGNAYSCPVGSFQFFGNSWGGGGTWRYVR